MNSTFSSSSIKAECIEWAQLHIGLSFTFRPNQLEAIVRVVLDRLNEIEKQVMEAPTGTGKSLIALIAAGVLSEYHGKKTYILASDIGLFQQYRDAIEKYHLPFGCLCGKDNYICAKNAAPISGSVCTITHCSPFRLTETKLNDSDKDTWPLSEHEKKKFECRSNCLYVQSLKRLTECDVVVLTYQLWLMSNIVPVDSPLHTFIPPKDFVIGDEAHNLSTIIQTTFSPEIDVEKMSDIGLLYDTFSEENKDLKSPDAFETAYYDILNATNVVDRFSKLTKYGNMLGKYVDAKEAVNSYIYNRSNISSDPDGTMKITNAYAAVTQLSGSIKYYIDLVDSLISQGIQPSQCIAISVNTSKTKLTFHCAYEADMVRSYFHKYAKYIMLMSATIGDFDTYRELNGMDDIDDNRFDAFEVPSFFDYSRSPIYYTSINRMSYAEKAKSTPKVVELIEALCKAKPNEHGIIQTGSYEFSQKLYELASPELKSRMIRYQDSRGKVEAIRYFASIENKILVGPSLMEGLNFEDDLCRFIIVMKLPYASLGDELVKTKMKVFPTWYSYDVCNKLNQSVGRGVRNEHDWAETYILDGCFADLVKRSKNLMSPTFVERLVKL